MAGSGAGGERLAPASRSRVRGASAGCDVAARGFPSGEGLAERCGPRVILARNLLATLRDRELAVVGQRLQQETGKTWRQVRDGEAASGVYRQSVELVSGRFAVLSDGVGFCLVPWQLVIGLQLGKQLSR